MTASNINSSRIKHTNATRYKIAQKIRSWRLKRGYTLKDLADKTGTNYHTLRRYEQGIAGTPTKELKIIAKALSVNVGTLFPRRRVLRKNFDKGKTQGTYNFTGKHTKTKVRELRKAIDTLTKFIRAEGKSNVKAVRIKMARNMVKAGFSVDIIYRATGLSADKYDNKWVKHQEEGREIKKVEDNKGVYSRRFSKKARCRTFANI
ncbi:helix-turn-helix domain-containing protein [Wolbachia pipientis]|uniref:helix-turn-helix domain-containing protein n=1 Tax=Wolbachia pipientis TaxID=955 RepID=UPI00287330B3|nr:helix-turn-helix transcriptional regulator [Wolbachia pipientis]